MRKTVWEYIILFVGLVLLQIVLLDNLSLGFYVVPQIYILFIAMLPSRTPPAVVMLWALAIGALIDLMSGTGGLNVIASLFAAFCRRRVMRSTLGTAAVAEGVTPLPSRVGGGKVLRYLTFMTAIHFTVYFAFETLTVQYFYLTLLKIVVSVAVSLVLCYICVLLFWGRRGRTDTNNLRG